MNLDKIKAIFFDFGGTIDSDGVDWIDRLYDFFISNKLPLVKEDFLNATEQAMKMISSDKASGSLSYRQTVDVFVYWTIKNLSIVIEDYKKSVVYPFYHSSFEKINKNKKIFEKMGRKYALGIVSNNFGNCEGWCKEFGIKEYFKIIIDSSIVGFDKPNKEIFLHACEKLKVRPEESVYIGDKFDIDMITPKNLLMTPIWINDIEPDNFDSKGVIRIRKLEELKKIFSIEDEIRLLI